MAFYKSSLWALLVVGVLSAPVRADQNDPRLDGLFEQLKNAPSMQAAFEIEQKIWRIWIVNGEEQVDGHMALGMQAMHVGSLRNSLEQFTKVIVLDPDFAEGWNKRATVHYMLGNLEKSMSDIQRTLALEPRHYGAISGLGLIFDATQNVEGALKAWQEVLQITPYNEAVRARVQELQEIIDGKPI